LLVSLCFVLADFWFVSSLSRLVAFGSALWLVHRIVRLNFPAVYRQSSAFVGVGLAALTLFFAFIGARAEHESRASVASDSILEVSFWEAQSRYLYEAFQALTLNMSVHDTNPELNALSFARVFAVLLVMFIAYQSIFRFCTNAISQVTLAYYGLCFVDRPQLVFGLGFVGTQIVRDLREKRKHVIVVERDPNNANIDVARELGAVVLIVDALQADLLQDVPFSAVDDIFVVSGSDELNVRVAITVKQSADAARKKRGDIANQPYLLQLWYRCFNRLRTDKPSTCYVRLYEHELHQVLQSAFAPAVLETSANAEQRGASEVTLKVFNTDQNAARLLVQDELCLDWIRPSKTNEVAMYTIVGFGPMGQAVATTLAHLAHFDNFNRSRLLVLDDSTSCDRNVGKFLSKYPKFTRADTLVQPLGEIQYVLSDDAWTPTSDGPGLSFATQCCFTALPPCPNDPKFLEKLHQLIGGAKDLAIKPAVIVCLEDDAEAFTWASVFERAWQDYVYREGLDASGGTDAALPIYVWLPDQVALRDIVDVPRTDQTITTIRSFGQASKSSSVTAIKGDLRDHLVEINSASYDAAIEAYQRLYAEQISEKSDDAPPLTYPSFLEFSKSLTDTQSNLLAADHAIIKYRVAGGTFDRALAERHWSLGGADDDTGESDVKKTPAPPDDFIFLKSGNVVMSLPRADVLPEKRTGKQDVPNVPLIETLGIMEHNRWSSEMLLRNYSYVKEEKSANYLNSKGKVKNYRTPSSFYQRSTLTAWKNLIPKQQIKDTMQAYYVMYHLNKISSKVKNENRHPEG